ncbi:MAG: hypothetical protein ACI4DO_04760 [Roseburia sp.]
MKNKKLLGVLVLWAVMVLGVTACGSYRNASTNKKEELATQLLHDKYNENFEIRELLREYPLDGYYTAVAYPTDNPDILFSVSVNSDGTGIADNYVDKMVSLQLSDELTHNLDGLNGEVVISSFPSVESVWLSDKNMTLNEYVEEVQDPDFRVYMFYCPEFLDTESLYYNMGNLYDGIVNMDSRVYLYVVDEHELQNICGYIQSNDDFYADFDDIADQGYKGYINYYDNEMEMDKEEFMEMVKYER